MNSPRWYLNELAQAINVPPSAADQPIHGISIDTRTLQPGDLYIAIKGDAHDGHAFIADAFAKGAAAVLVNDHFDAHTINGVCLNVPDTLIALQQLGTFIRKQSPARIIAVTGSAGKTTTKEMLKHILETFGRTVVSKASFNNHWGVPLSLIDLMPDTDFGVFEVGMNHAGEIAPLSKMIAPHIAIITTIAEAHIGYLGSIEAIATEKSMIFDGLTGEDNYTDGIAILNADMHCVNLIKARAAPYQHIMCSIKESSDVYLINTECRSGLNHVTACIFGTIITYTLSMVGIHYVQNTLLALAACHALGIDLAKAAQTLSTFTLPNGRGATHHLALSKAVSIQLIDDAYNANPASMKAGLMTLAEMQNRRRIAVLGEMLELGDASPAYHRAISDVIEVAGIDLVFCAGDHMRHLFDALPSHKQGAFAHAAKDLIPILDATIMHDDIIYVKGSKGSKVSLIVDHLIGNQQHS